MLRDYMQAAEEVACYFVTKIEADDLPIIAQMVGSGWNRYSQECVLAIWRAVTQFMPDAQILAGWEGGEVFYIDTGLSTPAMLSQPVDSGFFKLREALLLAGSDEMNYETDTPTVRIRLWWD